MAVNGATLAEIADVVYAAQPREGTETSKLTLFQLKVHQGLCSSTPRGDGNFLMNGTSIAPGKLSWFMQLNPARGRKLFYKEDGGGRTYRGLCSSTPRGDGNDARHVPVLVHLLEVYAAQPREGTETNPQLGDILLNDGHGLCSSTPRGDGNSCPSLLSSDVTAWFMQLNPARGRKLRLGHGTVGRVRRLGLCSSTPRGDGNRKKTGEYFLHGQGFMQLNPERGRKRLPLEVADVERVVYAAQPREGTETRPPAHEGPRAGLGRFMQLNPARGRKQGLVRPDERQLLEPVYAAQPREGTETLSYLLLRRVTIG